MISIESTDDPRVADYLDVTDAVRVRERGIVMAEGAEVVRTLASSRFPLRSLFLLESRVEQMADVIAAAQVPVFIGAKPVMSAIVGYNFHRGVLAASDRVETPVDLDRARTVFLLEAVANLDNCGAIFRNAKAFGVDAVLLDERSVDPLYRKAIRVSMGASLIVPFERRAAPSDFTVVALTPRPEAMPIDQVEWPARVALQLGTEGPGLEEETLANADLMVRIPMAPGMDSLNVATASGVAAYARFLSLARRDRA